MKAKTIVMVYTHAYLCCLPALPTDTQASVTDIIYRYLGLALSFLSLLHREGRSVIDSAKASSITSLGAQFFGAEMILRMPRGTTQILIRSERYARGNTLDYTHAPY